MGREKAGDFSCRSCECGWLRVRQSSKRQKIPDILETSEMQAIVAELQLRERVLLFLDISTGSRRGELIGIKWGDIDFANLLIDV